MIFAENVTADLQFLNKAANAGSLLEMSQLAHKMKPSLNHFGVTSLKEVMVSLEHPDNLNRSDIAYLVSELNRVVTEVLLGLQNDFPEVFK